MNFQTHLDNNRDLQQCITALLTKKENAVEWDIVNLVPDIFDGQDVLSILYRSFMQETNIPISLPVMSMFAYLSGYLVKNNVQIDIPHTISTMNCDLWIVSLGDSGQCKTLSKKLIEGCIPRTETGEKAISATFSRCVGPAAFFEELSEKNRTLYFQDECAQILKGIENPNSPLAELKEYFLCIYDNETVTRKKGGKVVGIVKDACLAVHWLNTIESFMKAVSTESLTDGFCQRFLFNFAHSDPSRPFDEYLFMRTKSIAKDITPAIEDIFRLPLHSVYRADEELLKMYERGGQFIINNHFNASLPESFCRKVLWCAWKYAVCYHLILGKSNDTIDREDYGYALKACLYHLYAVKKLLAFKSGTKYCKETEEAKYVLMRLGEVQDWCAAKGMEFTPRLAMRKIKNIKTRERFNFFMSLLDKNKPVASS